MKLGKLTPFLFEGEVTVRVLDRGGEPWFVAADVCRALGLTNPSEVVKALDDDEKGISSTDTTMGNQEVIVVSESGLYALVFKSRKPNAVRFRKWVTSEVLPALRRTGAYQATSPIAYPKPYMEWSLEEWRVKLAIVNTSFKVWNKAAAAWTWEHEGFPMPPKHMLPSWFQPTLIG